MEAVSPRSLTVAALTGAAVGNLVEKLGAWLRRADVWVYTLAEWDALAANSPQRRRRLEGEWLDLG